MKIVFIKAVLYCIVTVSFAQSPGINVLVKERSIGRFTETQEEIIVKEYIFPEQVYHSYIDTISKSITFQLRGLSNNGKWMNNRGKIVLYDLVGEKIKWSKSISYKTNRIQQYGNTIILTAGGLSGQSYCLNIETGKKMWKVQTNIYIVDPVNQIGIGYEFKTPRENSTLEGINLKNGKKLWQRELKNEYGWNDVLLLNDTTWMIVASGLHMVNIHDGSGWDYNTVTGDKDYKAATAKNVTGVALGLLTGTYLIFGPDLVTGIASNVFFDSTGFYFASKEKISQVRKDQGAWWHLLPEKMTSKSSIFAKADSLYMVNHGYAFKNQRLIDYGTPFFASFSKENGEKLFFQTFNTKKNPIYDFKILNNYLLLLFRDKIVRCSLIDGSTIFEMGINYHELGELKRFVGNNIYIDAPNSSLTNLVLSDISKQFVFTSNDKVLIFDSKLDIVGYIDLKRLYVALMKLQDFKLVVNEYQTIILNADNKKVVEMDITLKSAVLIGNKLYSIQNNSFFEIDLTNLIGQP